MLLFSNPMKFGVLHSLGAVFTFAGKLFIAAASGIIGYFILEYDEEAKKEVNTLLVPIVLFIVVGYAISYLFFMIYGISTDTIIVCFFHDKEIASNGGRPAQAPAPMKSFYEKFKK